MTIQTPPVASDSVSWAQRLAGMIDLGPSVQLNLILSVLVIVLVWGLRRLVLRIVEGHLDDVRSRYQWAKSSAYVAFVLAVLGVGPIWLEGLGSLGTFLGLLTAGLAIALRDLVANLAGWVFILWRRPFELGDRVQIGDSAGDVVDIRIFQFTLLEIGNWVHADQSTGRIIHVPNARLFSDPLANYTAEFEYIWHEVPVLVTFESDWRRAREILSRIVDEKAGGVSEEVERSMKRAARKFMIFYTKFTPTVYLSVEDSGVLLTARFLCKPRTRRGLGQEIWEAVLEAFHQEPEIDLAYPTRRVYHNLLEGKEGLRGRPPDWLPGPRQPGSGE